MRSAKYTPILALLFAMSAVSASPSSTTDDVEELMRSYGDEDFISIATGSKQLLSHAPAVASVITSEDIRAMGARDLDEVLETVPGLHVSRSPRAYSPLYTIRGIYSENNPQVLVLINDIPITNVYVGDRSQVWGGMPVNNISRIEVIRGPGSAIYGADAFSGTINIITKKHDEINGTETGLRSGSFNTNEGWIIHGGTWNGFDIALSVEVSKTDGHEEIIDADMQTILDFLGGTNASLAPGPVNLGRKSIESRADISRGDWRFRLGYQGRKDVGTGAGVGLALDPYGEGNSDRFNADLTYNTIFSRYWDLTAQLSYFDTNAETDLTLYPPGAFGAYPDGVIGSPNVYERHTRLGLSAFYHGFDSHRIRLGIGAIHDDMYKVKEYKNFASDFSPLTGDFSVVDVTNDPNNVFIQPNDRVIYYAFIQDEWELFTSLKLTGGVRYDDYSDFGDTVNPRAALVWRPGYDLTTKILYGRAFRAPAFNELYNINNPVALGNPDLKPETIDTYEIAFNFDASQDLYTSLNLFHYVMSDVIRFSPTTSLAGNSGEITGKGAELEARYNVTSRFKVSGNYAVQVSTDKTTDSKVANAPQHQIYLAGGWLFTDNWSLNGQISWIADRKRDPNDPRNEIDDYMIMDLTLRYRPVSSPWEFALSGRNIFDEDAREPSPRLLGVTPIIPNDLPLAGRQFFLEARYQMDHFGRN